MLGKISVMEAKINEIFTSIQGEGPYIGYKQLFIRFCGCNLNCKYCDTEYIAGVKYSPDDLYNAVRNDLEYVHSVSLTGGEPLLSYKFLKEFLPKIKDKTKVYLETNATLTSEFKEIKDYVDIVSADIKLPSATGNDTLNLHEDFLNNCSGVKTFAKIVFDKNITEDEISFCINVARENNLELILQPKMNKNIISVSADFCSEILNKFLSEYANVRLIPQVHKFLNVR